MTVMEKYILDTNTWIEHFHQCNGVTQRIMALQTTQIFASEVTLAELTFGAHFSDNYERHILEPEWLRRYITVLDISDVFEEYAQIRCALKNKSVRLTRRLATSTSL